MTSDAESLFQTLCIETGLKCERIPTASDREEQRPDFAVVGHSGVVFFAEVKAIAPNPAEANQIQATLEGRTGSFRTVPGARMRELIAKANSQLRALTKGQAPGVLVIYNRNGFLSFHTEPYAILTAMRGLDLVPFLIPSDPEKHPIAQEVRSGPKKKMTRDDNTSISAILIPVDTPGVSSIYHNRYAACPIPRSALAGDRFHHFRISQDERSWEPC